MIERGAQLDEFRLLFCGRQGRQMQLIVDAQLTSLGGFGHGGDAGPCTFNERLKECLRLLRQCQAPIVRTAFALPYRRRNK